ncbi:MAG TPA: TolC family protein [Terriglobia bacterium]|jgi:outer membrane protein TolC
MKNIRCLILVAACIAGLLLPSMPALSQDLQPIALKDAVNTALRNSREVALAQARYNQSARAVDVNRSAFQPNLFTGSGAAFNYGFPQTPGGAPPTILNLSYIQSLFNPPQRAQVRASQERQEVQRLELEKTQNSVALQTSSAYLELAKVRHSLELMRNERESNTRIIGYTQQRVTEGYELPIEGKKAERAAAVTEQRIRQLESRESELQEQLAAAMGLPPARHIEVMTEPLALQTSDRKSDVVDRAVESSLDLRESEYERRAREHIVNGQNGAKWPTVDIIGEYGRFAPYNNLQDYYRQFQENNVTVGIQIKIPLISAQRSSNVAMAKSELNTAEMELRNRRQNVELEAARQFNRVRVLESAREVARLDHEIAQDNLQVIQANFQEGRANLRDVERARNEESEKWVTFLDGDFDWQKAQLELLNITGELGRIYQ